MYRRWAKIGDWADGAHAASDALSFSNHMRKLSLPKKFAFQDKDVFDFGALLAWFDWTPHNEEVVIDFSDCRTANYQALSLLVLYIWRLRIVGCHVTFYFGGESTVSEMWKLMGARGWSQVLYENQNFKGHHFKPLIAVRTQKDFGLALSKAEQYTKGFDVEYEKTLRYVISELLYNTLEHGQFWFENHSRQCPSIIQFTWYKQRNELSFIVADLGVGVKKHLEQTYPPFENDADAIRYAIRPQVSGTFGLQSSYSGKNNAGVGLYISSNIVKRLSAEMFIVSGRGLLHISPRDVTDRTLKSSWPGTFVLINLKLGRRPRISLHQMMSEFREAALREMDSSHAAEQENRYTLSMENYFGSYAENKEGAIRIRDTKLLPALDAGKSVLLDFANVVSAPHSFLSALLATPARVLGMDTYKKIKITNAVPEIRETIDYIFDENTTGVDGEQ